jgi:hypothetical protein
VLFVKLYSAFYCQYTCTALQYIRKTNVKQKVKAGEGEYEQQRTQSGIATATKEGEG